jgi:hypothetical protein
MDYMWSSYPAFLRKVKRPAWLETRFLLGTFGSRERDAIKDYISFVEDVDINNLEDPFRQASGGFILGSPEFISWARNTFLHGKTGQNEIPQLRKLKPRPPVKIIVQAICNEFDCKEESIVEKGRKRNLARDVAIYLSRTHTSISSKELGLFYGGISGAAITMKYKQISEEVSRNKSLKRRMNKINKRILNI